MSTVHKYRCYLDWADSTAEGFEHYSREHRASCPPARAVLRLTSDPAFRGDPDLLNPEQMLLAAASSCQLLSFLSVAARAKIEVTSYTDEAEAVMPEDDKPMRITEIVLRPRIAVRNGVDEHRVRECVSRAHEKCFIANSLSARVRIEPRIELTTHSGRIDPDDAAGRP